MAEDALVSRAAYKTSLTQEGPTWKTNRTAQVSSTSRLVARLTGEPGWMPADMEHLLGYFCIHRRGLIEESMSYADEWALESAETYYERPHPSEPIPSRRPHL